MACHLSRTYNTIVLFSVENKNGLDFIFTCIFKKMHLCYYINVYREEMCYEKEIVNADFMRIILCNRCLFKRGGKDRGKS